VTSFVLPVDKPEGPTSHDVVDAARRALGLRRIGHTGTLDPFASGLLLLCVGGATRLAEYLSGLDKTYEAVAVLGVRTDTLDLDGEVVDRSDSWQAIGADAVSRAFEQQRGEIGQIPPQYSAKKVGGVAMHRRARRGEQVALAPQRVVIHEIDVLEVASPEVRFRIRCSSGTYVRSIARDAGDTLGCGAHLSSLRRTAIGEIAVERAVSLHELAEPEAVRAALIDPLAAVSHLPSVRVDQEAAVRLSNGQRLSIEDGPTGLVAVEREGRLVAVGEVGEGMLSPRKVFRS